MEPDLENAIHELSMRMRLLRVIQEDRACELGLTERDFMILELLNDRGKMTISEIAAAYPSVTFSTISTDVTKLWRQKQLLSKTINPENQRVTLVELTDKGEEIVELWNKQRTERYAKLFEALKATDEEKQVLLRIIDRAVKFFDKYLEPQTDRNK